MADDLTRPYIGYRSAGRRPERQQDRRASADAPLAALRGMISGVAGAPGDIESLVRMLPGLSEQTVLPTSEDIERRLPLRGVSETPAGRAFTTAGQLGGGFYTGPGSPLRAIAALPSAVSRAGREFAVAAGQPAVNVVKPKGGNWLAGSAEHALKPMRQFVREPAYMERLALDEAQGLMQPGTVENVANQNARAESVNRWLESKLAKYIRNEMATPEDPIRALAERGVLHMEPYAIAQNPPLRLEINRSSQGFPIEGMGKSDAARFWEQMSDMAIRKYDAGDLTQRGIGGSGVEKYLEENPWLLKVPPETAVYDPFSSVVQRELGFGHLVDELKNAINPASGLPENLRWKYQDLDKVTVPQAVQRVADINAWRAAQKAEADLARAMNPATHVFKEYPEQGFKWVELKAPKDDVMTRGEYADPTFDIPEAAQDRIQAQAEREVRRLGLDDESDDYMYAIQDRVQELSQEYAAKNKPLVSKSLEEALKYEGETMGHCVGGYCEDVASGRSKIYSLRDKKGQPHVTIEVRPGAFSSPEEALRYEQAPENGLPSIVQIKGSGKKDPGQRIRHAGTGYKDNPDAHLLPMVQDFVRSQKWGRVGDLENTGLKPISSVPERKMFEDAGMKLPEYLTQREHDALIDEFNRLTKPPFDPEFFNREFGGGTGINPSARGEGFAEGGLVGGANFPTYDFDPARIDSIVGELHAMNAG